MPDRLAVRVARGVVPRSEATPTDSRGTAWYRPRPSALYRRVEGTRQLPSTVASGRIRVPVRSS